MSCRAPPPPPTVPPWSVVLQTSNVFVLPIQAPTLDIVDVYDTLQLSDAEKLVDSCLSLVGAPRMHPCRHPTTITLSVPC